ncbi:MAG: 6-carboxytetrahydropterin synthase, partial [Pseudomonadota bacterium]
AYQDLDTVPQFEGTLTTTEFLCKHIFDEMAGAVRRGDLGPGSDQLSKIRVTLGETHLARAWFEGPIGG